MVAIALAAVVFASDALLAYLEGVYIRAWTAEDRSKAVQIAGLFAVAVGINAMGFITLHWPMLLPSAAGAMLGTYASFPKRKKALDI